MELVLDAHAEIGESPIWNPDSSELLWVDILAGLVHRFRPSDKSNATVGVGQPVGAVALTQDERLLLAVRDGFALLDADGAVQMLAEVEADNEQSRMNDGACDAQGRYWAGTTQADRAAGSGSLYRLQATGDVQREVANLTLPNGIDWSPDGRSMYFIDSATNCVDAFAFDGETGRVSDRRRLVEIPSEAGMPDGLTVDAEGCLWIAMYRGGALRRYSPAGELDRIVELPVSLVTSCTFGDTDLGTLYITTATRGLDSEALLAQPGAGGLFRLRPGVTGLPAHRFGVTPRP